MSTLTPIAKIFARVHSPGLAFPDTVAALLALGVTRYQVDYASSLATAYSPSTASASITAEQIPIPAPHVKPATSWNHAAWPCSTRWPSYPACSLADPACAAKNDQISVAPEAIPPSAAVLGQRWVNPA